MRKILLFLLVCAFGFLLVSCDNHSHELAENWTNDSVNHWHTCIVCDELIDVTAHSYTEWNVVQEATESTIGTEKHVCTVCGYEETREIPKLNHTHNYTLKSDLTYHWKECNCGDILEKNNHTGGEATETEKALCEVCGTPYGEFKIPTHEHEAIGEWKTDGTYHWKECSCGEKVDNVVHTGGQATCTEKAKCEICKVEYGSLLEHNYTELKHDSVNHWYECSCGEIEPDSSEAHKGGEATDTEKAKCEVCGVEYGELNPSYHKHNYEIKSDSEYHWSVCNCGEVTEKRPHRGGEITAAMQPVCVVCGQSYGGSSVITVDGNTDDWSEEQKANALKGWYEDSEGRMRGLEYMAFVDENHVYIYTRTITASNAKKSIDVIFNKDKERPYTTISSLSAGSNTVYYNFIENVLLENGLYETISEVVIDKSSYINSNGNIYLAIWFNGCDASFEPLSWHEGEKTAWVLNHRSPWYLTMSHQKVTETGFEHYHDLTSSDSNICGWCQEEINLAVAIDGNSSDWSESVLATGITSATPNNVFTTAFIDNEFVYIFIELTQLAAVEPNYISIYSKFSANFNGIRANERFNLTWDSGYQNLRPYCSGKKSCEYNYCDCDNGFAKMALSTKTNEVGQKVACFEVAIDKLLFINQNPSDANYGLYRYEIQIGPNLSPNQNVSSWKMMIVNWEGLHTHNYKYKFDEYKHWTECSCGLSTAKVSHSGGDTSSSDNPVCSGCNQEYVVHNHGYEIKFDEEYHWGVCSCGEVSSKVSHSGGKATETEKAVCTDCGQEYGELADYAIIIDGKTDDWSEEQKANALKGWYKDSEDRTRGLEYMAFVDENYIYIYTRTITASNTVKSLDIVFADDRTRPYVHLAANSISNTILYSYFEENVLLENGLYETISEFVVDKASYVNAIGNVYLSIWFNGCDESFEPLSWHEESAKTAWVLNHRSPWYLDMSHQKVTEDGFDHYHDLMQGNTCGWCQEEIELAITADGDVNDWSESVLATGITSTTPNNVFTTAFIDDEFVYIYIELTQLASVEPNYISIYSKFSANFNGIRANERFDLTWDAGYQNLRPYCAGKKSCVYNYCDCNNGFAKMAMTSTINEANQKVATIELVIDKSLFINQNPTDANYGLCRYEIQIGPNLTLNQNVSSWKCMIAATNGLHNAHNYVTKFDETQHWTECPCGFITSKESHKGGTATETSKAICTECGQEYGKVLNAEYGSVFFANISIYDNDYDGVIIRPMYSNPELCEDEEFTYELESEDYCYIENGKVYFIALGKTKVVARSEHFDFEFYISCEETSLKGHADAVIQRLCNSYQETETLFIGDSFFEFWENGTNGIKTFKTSFGEYKAMNIGISGSTTHLWRGINYKLSYFVEAPKNIVINLGTNNVNLKSETGVEVAANIQALIQDYLEMFPETNIYYLSITRCDGYYADNWDNASESNELMKEYCKNTDRVNYLDVMELYGDNYANLVSDGLHPNQDGYNLFEQIIKENVPFDKKD